LSGARVILHLNDASSEYAEPHRLERIVSGTFGRGRRADRSHRKAGRRAAPHRRCAAIWAKPKSEVKSEEYAEFYRGLSGQYDEPALTVALARRGTP